MKSAAVPSLISPTALSLIAVLNLLSPVNAQVQKLPSLYSQVQIVEPNDANTLRPTQGNSILSIEGGERLMAEAAAAISEQNYPLAAKKLQDARQLYNQLSNFYQELNASFTGIDPRISDSQRQKALETAQKRDEATYQLALVHRAQNQPHLAVPLLIQIIKSQNPTRDLGQKAYQQLFELGFVDAPFPRPGANSSSSR
ncbi:hypothetical protein [Anabaenopsis elenkinii]|jgi:hypothetical protein|uniref:Uncharacterized protein n=1 Tax=Anabaenopsis elenkinii CCIBt3563 TaxID=2779889 RepID=A0A7S6U3Y2_9CYAN|nr:hypothetical protein [Anabaenopsis elenkinii]QOV22936.1 hypothetical protein IM676_00795 [Anabaenopsis elenkinii CCIBt3563]